jgi:DNA-binding NtrC family response regulator
MFMHTQTSIDTKRVIVIDYDAATTELFAELLQSEGLRPICYPALPISATCIEQTQAQLLILELGLGDPGAALALLGSLRQNAHTRALPVIVNSTDDRLLARLAAPLRDLDCAILAKPFELDDFFSLISMCLEPGRSQTQRLGAE